MFEVSVVCAERRYAGCRCPVSELREDLWEQRWKRKVLQVKR